MQYPTLIMEPDWHETRLLAGRANRWGVGSRAATRLESGILVDI